MRTSKGILITIALSIILSSLPEDAMARKGWLGLFGKDKEDEVMESNRDERNAIRRGNKLFNQDRYAEAEVEYMKAIESYPQSDIANYNLAVSRLKQGGSHDANDTTSLWSKSRQAFENLIKTSDNEEIVKRSYYNLGNMAFEDQDYGKSIEMYKSVLRRDPDDDKARDNLRLAQKKQQEQEQNQDQNQDQQQQQEQQQEQNQDNEEQNQDQQEQQQQQQNQDQQQQQQDQSMSEANADQILKAMQDAEKSTQQKVNAAKLKEEEATRRRTGNLW